MIRSVVLSRAAGAHCSIIHWSHSYRTTPTKHSNKNETSGDLVYLITDEYSMISTSFPAKLSRNIEKKGSVENLEASHANDSLNFGGINVILCGDLHQFSPVAGAK